MIRARKSALHSCQNMFNSVMKSQQKKPHQRKLPHKLKKLQLLKKLPRVNKLDLKQPQKLRSTTMLPKLDNSWLNNKLKWKCKLKKLKSKLRPEIKHTLFHKLKEIPKNIKFKD